MKSTRITVKRHNIEFLKTIGQQMGITDIAEVLNYLLLDIKGLNYRYGDKPQPQLQPIQAPIGYTFDTSAFEKAAPIPDVDRNYEETDPIIARMASLIEEC